jgi:DNA-binding transcriptional MerR regulator
VKSTRVPLMTGETARLLGRSVEMVRIYEKTGRLPAVRTGSGIRLFNVDDVEKLRDELVERRAKQ